MSYQSYKFKFQSTVFILFAILGALGAQTRNEAFEKGLQTISEQSLKAQTEFLSSDWFAGRETATAGAYMAADYIASQFKQFGLSSYQPLSSAAFSGYLQPVKLIASEVVSSNITIIKAENNNVAKETFNHLADFYLSAYSKDIELEAEVFFGSYGFNQPSFEYLKGATKGQILLRIEGFPGMADTASVGFREFGKMSEMQRQAAKNRQAREAGFIAILEYNPLNPSPVNMSHPNAYRTPAEKPLHKRSSGIYKKQVRLISESNDQIPVIAISEDIINALYPNWKDLLNAPKPIKAQINKNTRVNIRVNTERKLIECQNVLAVIEGEIKDEIIVAGAHYDHLGEYDGYIWNGADDNASGTVGIIALARAFAESGIKPKKTIVFAAWTAEERGLHGSTHFVKTHPNPALIKYYLNYDMIGREADPENPNMNVSFIYTKWWQAAPELIQTANEQLNLGLNVRYFPSENPTGGSDQAPFAQKNIPIMWFYTGNHSDYHGPFDHADKINYKKMTSIVRASFSALWKLANE